MEGNKVTEFRRPELESLLVPPINKILLVDSVGAVVVVRIVVVGIEVIAVAVVVGVVVEDVVVVGAVVVSVIVLVVGIEGIVVGVVVELHIVEHCLDMLLIAEPLLIFLNIVKLSDY